MDSLQSLLMDGSLSKSADGTTVDFVFSDIFGYSPVIFIILLLLVLLTSCISSVLMGYLSTLLGQLVEKYRLAASIGFYMAIYMITQTITSLVRIAPTIKTSTYFISNFFGSMFPAAIISQIILIVIFYTASLLLIRRQPNLE